MNFTELGFFAVSRGDYQEAVNIFKRALEQKKEAGAFFGFGVAHYHLGDLPAARWAFYQALELQRDHAGAQEYLVRIEQGRREKPPAIRQSRFRTGKGCLEILDGAWKKFFVKGINIGLGLPGYFPGEYAIKRATYLTWFEQISGLGVNAVRVYTVQPPGF
jgi:tetratricopeptide (TPR) repeat protein